MQLSVCNGSGSKSWTIFWGCSYNAGLQEEQDVPVLFPKSEQNSRFVCQAVWEMCCNIILQQLEYSLIIFRWAVCLTICTVWGRTERGTKAQFKRSHVSRNIYMCISCFLWTTVMMKHLFPPNPPSRNVDRPKKKKNTNGLKKGCLSEGKHLLGNRISTLWGRIK